MTSAKITRCKHYFHGVCLRKWLYVQDRCPLCHEIIMHHEPLNGEKQQVDPNNDAPRAAAGGGVAAAVGGGGVAAPAAAPAVNATGGGALLQNAAEVRKVFFF